MAKAKNTSTKAEEKVSRSPLAPSDPEPGDQLQVPVRSVSGAKSPSMEYAQRDGGGRDDSPPDSKKANRSPREMPGNRNQQVRVDALDKYMGARPFVPPPSPEGSDPGVAQALARGSGGNVVSVQGGPQAQSRSIGDWCHIEDVSGKHSDFMLYIDRQRKTDFDDGTGTSERADHPEVTDYFSRKAGLDTRHFAIEHRRRDDVVLHPWDDDSLGATPARFAGRLDGPHSRERAASGEPTAFPQVSDYLDDDVTPSGEPEFAAELKWRPMFRGNGHESGHENG